MTGENILSTKKKSRPSASTPLERDRGFGIIGKSRMQKTRGFASML